MGTLSKSKEQLEALCKSELIDLIMRSSQSEDAAAAAAAAAAAGPSAGRGAARPKAESKKARAFDMSRYSQRHTALRVAYLGPAYQGSAYTPGADTVSGRLLEACTKTCLIADRESCGLTLGGRTDKGVSAFGQVFALRLRSNLPAVEDSDKRDAAAAGDEARRERKEIDYVRVLNRVLPEDIRVLAAQPVADDFSARFSASHRTYRYFFVRGDLALEPMREAAARLQGEFDFRNFCKIDPAVSNFRRTVLSAEIRPAAGSKEASPSEGTGRESALDVFEFEVKGTAFLYHQVRCMVAVLFLVGKGLEHPSIVDELLDIAKHPARPNYEIAPDGPLLLYDIGYEGVAWEYGAMAAEELAQHWGHAQETLVLRSAMLHAKRASLLTVAASAAPAATAASPHKGPGHVPLLERPTAASVEMVHAQAAERAGRKKRDAVGDSETAAT